MWSPNASGPPVLIIETGGTEVFATWVQVFFNCLLLFRDFDKNRPAVKNARCQSRQKRYLFKERGYAEYNQILWSFRIQNNH